MLSSYISSIKKTVSDKNFGLVVCISAGVGLFTYLIATAIWFVIAGVNWFTFPIIGLFCIVPFVLGTLIAAPFIKTKKSSGSIHKNKEIVGILFALHCHHHFVHFHYAPILFNVGRFNGSLGIIIYNRVVHYHGITCLYPLLFCEEVAKITRNTNAKAEIVIDPIGLYYYG